MDSYASSFGSQSQSSSQNRWSYDSLKNFCQISPGVQNQLKQPLYVELGPGILGNIFHGIQDPIVRHLVEHSSHDMHRILPEIPFWVKNPDYDRIDWLNRFIQLMWRYLDKEKILEIEYIKAIVPRREEEPF